MKTISFIAMLGATAQQRLLAMNFRMFPASAALAASMCLNTLAAAHATTVALNFSSLPSAQGWTYDTVSGGPLEAKVFTLSGGVLNQNTIGTGIGDSSKNPWYYFTQDFGSAPFTETMTAKVKAVEGASGGFQAITFGVNTNGWQFNIHITNTGVASLPGNFTFDPFIYHTYRIAADPQNPSHTFQVYVDNNLLGSLGAVTNVNIANVHRLFLGDGSSAGNGNVDITYFSFSNEVPLPATLPLFASVLGGAGFLTWRRWRKSKNAAALAA